MRVQGALFFIVIVISMLLIVVGALECLMLKNVIAHVGGRLTIVITMAITSVIITILTIIVIWVIKSEALLPKFSPLPCLPYGFQHLSPIHIPNHCHFVYPQININMVYTC